MNQTDKFSLRRLRLIARFYGVSIMTQMWIYALTVIGFFFIAILCRRYIGFDAMLWPVASVIFSWMITLGPIAFYKYDNQQLTTQLPALGAEKALFITGYVFLIVPLLMVGVWTLCWFIGELLPVDNVNYNSFWGLSTDIVMKIDELPLNNSVAYLSNISSWFMTISIALYVVICSVRNRVVKCILAVFVTKIVVSIIGFIIGIIYAFDKVIDSVEIISEISGSTQDEINEAGYKFILPFVQDFMVYFSVAGLIVAVIFFILSWRKICRRQV